MPKGRFGAAVEGRNLEVGICRNLPRHATYSLWGRLCQLLTAKRYGMGLVSAKYKEMISEVEKDIEEKESP